MRELSRFRLGQNRSSPTFRERIRGRLRRSGDVLIDVETAMEASHPWWKSGRRMLGPAVSGAQSTAACGAYCLADVAATQGQEDYGEGPIHGYKWVALGSQR